MQNKELDDIDILDILSEETGDEIYEYSEDGEYTFYKENKERKVWDVSTSEQIFGEHLFSFDKKKIYNLFADYPHNMTEEEIKILDEEEPELTGLLQFRKEIKDFKTR